MYGLHKRAKPAVEPEGGQRGVPLVKPAVEPEGGQRGVPKVKLSGW